MSDLTEIAGVALRSIIGRANAETTRDEWGMGYLRGQVAIVAAYMEPNKDLLAEANKALDRLKIRQIQQAISQPKE